MKKKAKKASKKKIKNVFSAKKKKSKKVKAVDATEEVVKMDERDALRFGKLDAEMRNRLQGIQLKEFEIQDVKRKNQEQLNSLRQIQAQLKVEVSGIKPFYDALLNELSKRYGIPKERIIVDPDSGTIRDSKQDI